MRLLRFALVLAVCFTSGLFGQLDSPEGRVNRLVARLRNVSEIPNVENEIVATCGNVSSALCYTLLNDLILAVGAVGNVETNALGMRIAERARKLPGLSPAQTFEPMQWIGSLYWQKGQLPQAESLLRQAIAESTGQLPAHDPVFVSLRITLGAVLRRLVKLDEAAAIYKQIIADIKEHPKHPETTNVMNNLAVVYKDMGVYKEQEELLLEVLKRKYEQNAKQDQEVVMPLINLAILYESVGRTKDALEPLQRALAIQRADPGLGDLNTARALHRLGRIYTALGNHQEAQAHLNQSLEKYKDTDPSGNESIQVTIDLAFLHEAKYFPREAEDLLQKSLVDRTTRFGKDDLRVVPLLTALGQLHQQRGAYTVAENYLTNALEITAKRAPGVSDRVAVAKRVLGDLRNAQGRFAEAVALYKEYLEIERVLLGPRHHGLASTLAAMAIANYESGQTEDAASQMDQAIQIQESVGRGSVPFTASILRKAGLLQLGLGNHAKAERYLKNAMEILRNAYGIEHIEVAQSSLDLARFYGAQKRFADAYSHLEDSLRSFRQSLGEEHPLTQEAILAYGSLLARDNRPAQAAGQFQKVVRNIRLRKADVHGAFPDRILHVAAFYLSQGQHEQVEELIGDSLELLEGLFRVNLLGLDPAQRKQMTAKGAADRDFILNYGFAPTATPAAMALAARTGLLFKGLRMQSDLESANLTAQHGANLRDAMLRRVDLSQLRKAAESHRLEIVKSASPGLGDLLAKADARIFALDQEDEKLQDDLRKFTVIRQLTDKVAIEDLQHKLNDADAFLDIVTYRPANSADGPHYGAILHRGRQSPVTIDLGAESAIDKVLSQVEAMSAIKGPDTIWKLAEDPASRDLITVLRPAAELRAHRSKFQKLLAALHVALMEPIRAKLGGQSFAAIRSWIISPDGRLGRLSWEMLWNESTGRYLREDAKVRYAESIRAFVLNNLADATGLPVAFLNPSYGTNAKVGRVIPPNRLSAAGAWSGPALPLFQGRFQRYFEKRYPKHITHLGGAASELAFRSTSRSEAVFIWTHGRYLDRPTSQDDLERVQLALANVNEFGRTKDSDGLVTGRDVAQRDWRGTKLAALIGCQTGVGTPDNGEGVQGLRRALYLAGTSNQLLTMWSVAAAPTVRWMELFLEASAKHSFADATDIVQNRFLAGTEILRDANGAPIPLNHPLFWAGLTISGE